MYFDLKKYLNKGKLYNFFTGARGCGKTFSFKVTAIERFKESGGQFVYLRRYASELEPKKIASFFDEPALKKKFPDDQIIVENDTAFINGHPFGYFRSLSRQLTDKGIQTFDDVTLVCMDEFIIAKNRLNYLPNEPELFEDALENISRLRDVQYVLLSNAVTMINPYYLFYNIRFTPNSPNVYNRGDILAVRIDSAEYSAYKANTRRGKVLAGTKYFDYAFMNEARFDNETNLERKTVDARLLAAVEISGRNLGIWKSVKFGKYYISEHSKGARIKYVFDFAETNAAGIMINYKSAIMKNVMRAAAQGRLYYENQTCKNLFLKIIK